MENNQKGLKDDSEKLRYDLLPVIAVEELVRVYNHGAKKYGERNWEKGINYSRIIGAIYRHLSEVHKGNDIDDDSGLYHAAQIAFNGLALVYYSKKNKDLDDRWKE